MLNSDKTTGVSVLHVQLLTEFLLILKKPTCVDLLAKLKSLYANFENIVLTNAEVCTKTVVLYYVAELHFVTSILIAKRTTLL